MVASLTLAASAQVQRFEPATPESQGVSAEAVTELGKAAAEFVDNGSAVGLELLVIKNRRTIFHESYGFADREDKKSWNIAPESATICNIRSMSKTFTGAAAQILIDRGTLSLDDKVSRFLPGFDNDQSREITVRQLMTHRSGLPLTILSDPHEFPDLQAQANAAGEKGPEFEPDSKFWYSDAGADALAAVVEVVSGEKLDAFVAREIFEPLGMSDSFYGMSKDDGRLARVGSLYIGAAGAYVRYWKPGDDLFYDFAWGSQSAFSTPLDYARFVAMWMDDGKVGEKQVLSREAVQRTLTPASPMTMLGSDAPFPTDFRGLRTYYGQMSVLYCDRDDPSRVVAISHSGSDGTILWAWPEADLIVACFTQSRGGTAVLRLEDSIDRLLLHAGQPVEAEAVPERLQPYLGTYIASFGSFENAEFKVLYKNGKLAIDIPGQLVFDLLEPDAEGKWAFELAPTQVQVSFVSDEAGKTKAVQLHQSGMVFDVPRKGTPEADELLKPIVIERAVLDKVVGKYHDDAENRVLEVKVDDEGVLTITAPPGVTFELRPMRGASMTWIVKQNPSVALSFQTNADGKVVSMTRTIGDQSLVMKRTE